MSLIVNILQILNLNPHYDILQDMNETAQEKRLIKIGRIITAAGLSAIITSTCNPAPSETIQTNNPVGKNSSTPSLVIKPYVSLPAATAETTIPPSPSPTPESTIPTESFAPSTPAPIESASALEQTLTDWVDGKIKVPKAKMFLLPDGEKARLNVIDSQPQPSEWYPTFQGYFLGTQVVDNHLIAYIGSQDGKGNNYFVPLNIGDLNKGYVTDIFDDPDQRFPLGTSGRQDYPA